MDNHNAKLLDCTLRDGAYLIDKTFGDDVINGMIRGLDNAKIDIIEIGFLQNEGFGDGKTVFMNGADAERFVPVQKGNTMYTVLADLSRYNVNNLDINSGKTFDAVRACFFKKERFQIVDFCNKVKEKGYKVFVQPVDILGYTDKELIELIEQINILEPYCFSIVDTFGSMYAEDLQRIYSLINHNLTPECRIGFHSHNNMQMSSALSQDFLRMTQGVRQVVIDATISGMGRGAGNTPTELIAEYMVKKLGYNYDLDAILDIIDNYMDGIRARCKWGYSTNYFLAGCYSAHVNNIFYLNKKNSIRSKDIRYILNKIGSISRKRYYYDLLEQTYLEYMNSEIDDGKALSELAAIFNGRNVVMIAPGNNAVKYSDTVLEMIDSLEEPIVVAVNFIPGFLEPDYIYMSNVRRYDYWKDNKDFQHIKKILTSNIIQTSHNDYIVSFENLIKCGWENMDNSCIMLLRLLDILDVKSVFIAGMDGYTNNPGSSNYASTYLELENVLENPIARNAEISEMIKDFIATKKSNIKIKFITPSKFETSIGDYNE